MSKKSKVVVIGASYRGMHGFLKNIVERHPDYEIAAICDITMGKIQDLNDYFGSLFKGYTDCGEMLAVEKPDVAIIANIDRVHVDYLEMTMAAGVRTVVEKPLCVDADQCRRIRAASAKHPDVEAALMRRH
ncbi:MAG: Gfo/Idh/MocA family oxidoreductase [Victivallales bacterium]|nr:Gfo/Idh/MocA family oxidoreductase [Victivallales bacterium]